jgi:2-polyprenyl-3-methyl-5-hydroxy-6-metoxy-1,4-benzoquinol methylase
LKCPACGSTAKLSESRVKTAEFGNSRTCKLLDCPDCGVRFLSDYDADRTWIYGPEYAAWGSSRDREEEESTAASKKEAFSHQLRVLLKYIDDPVGKRLLDIGTGPGFLLEVATGIGFDCRGVELSKHAAATAEKKFPGRIHTGTLEDAGFEPEQFEVITMTDVIEHIARPHSLLVDVQRLLTSGGLFLIITPDTDSWTRRLMGERWFQYKYEHVIYWNRRSLQNLLARYGLRLEYCGHNWKHFRVSYYSRYFRRYTLPLNIERLLLLGYSLLPPFVREMSFPNPVSGELIAVARKA